MRWPASDPATPDVPAARITGGAVRWIVDAAAAALVA